MLHFLASCVPLVLPHGAAAFLWQPKHVKICKTTRVIMFQAPTRFSRFALPGPPVCMSKFTQAACVSLRKNMGQGQPKCGTQRRNRLSKFAHLELIPGAGNIRRLCASTPQSISVPNCMDKTDIVKGTAAWRSFGGTKIGHEKSAQSFLAKSFSKSGMSRPKSLDIPATPCLKQQKKATCIKFLSRISWRLGPGCPRNIPPKNFMFRLLFRTRQDQDNIGERQTGDMRNPGQVPQEGGVPQKASPDRLSMLGRSAACKITYVRPVNVGRFLMGLV